MNDRTLAIVDAKSAWRTHAMFRAMSADPLLREQFATDPALIFCDYVLSDSADEAEAEIANQLIFAVVSSPHLRHWMGAYSRRLGGRSPSRHAFATQFAGAVASARDPLPALALLRAAATGESHFLRQADFFRAVLVAMGGAPGASGTEMSPGTATEMSPGGGTEMSPGAARLSERLAAEVRIAGRISSSILRAEGDGTEMSPGGGTEQSPGGGTEMSPGAIRRIDALAAALRRAELFLADLMRAADGTEMSPGGGTEMSPGGGTEMSPGASRLFERLAIELASAARFAAQLRRVESDGTEMSPGGGTEQSPGGGGTEMSPGAQHVIEAMAAALRRAELFSLQLVRADSGTEMSPGTATEMSPGGGTEMSPGAVRLTDRLAAEFDRAARYVTELRRAETGGTEMSPGGGTEQSPGGGGTEMSPGALRLAEALMAALRRAELFSAQLARADAGTEMSPGGGTEQSPGGGTEMSPGASRLAQQLAEHVKVAARAASVILRAEMDGTEMSPGGGTEQSPGGGTEMSPGALRLIDALATTLSRVELLLAQVVLAEDGTEMSPGGTEVSPGGGTEVSPGGAEVSPGEGRGGLWGVRLPAYVAESLSALVQYALALRRQGLLSVSGFEGA